MVIRRIIAALAVVAVSVSSCGKLYGGEGVSDNVGWDDYELFDLYEDGFGNRGIVADKYSDELRSWIIVLSADETQAQWSLSNELVYKIPDGFQFNPAYIRGEYFGLEMNRLVERAGVERFPAFEWCQAKNRDGRPIHSSSWILPAYDELIFIFEKGTQRLNAALRSIGGTEITQGELYWSAVEDIDDAFKFADASLPANDDYDALRRAVPMTPDCGFPTDKQFYWGKRQTYRVRAIKYIYFKTLSKDEYGKTGKS